MGHFSLSRHLPLIKGLLYIFAHSCKHPEGKWVCFGHLFYAACYSSINDAQYLLNPRMEVTLHHAESAYRSQHNFDVIQFVGWCSIYVYSNSCYMSDSKKASRWTLHLWRYTGKTMHISVAVKCIQLWTSAGADGKVLSHHRLCPLFCGPGVAYITLILAHIDKATFRNDRNRICPSIVRDRV